MSRNGSHSSRCGGRSGGRQFITKFIAWLRSKTGSFDHRSGRHALSLRTCLASRSAGDLSGASRLTSRSGIAGSLSARSGSMRFRIDGITPTKWLSGSIAEGNESRGGK